MDRSHPLQQELSPPQLSSEGELSGNACPTIGQLSSGQQTQYCSILGKVQCREKRKTSSL